MTSTPNVQEATTAFVMAQDAYHSAGGDRADTRTRIQISDLIYDAHRDMEVAVRRRDFWQDGADLFDRAADGGAR